MKAPPPGRPPPDEYFGSVRPATPSQETPILAEQASSGPRPKGCGCLIFVLMLVAAGIYFGPGVLDALDDLQGGFGQSVPATPAPVSRSQSCGPVKRVLRSRPPGPSVAEPRDLSEVLAVTPPEGFIPEEKLVARVQVGQWIGGMGDPRLWARAFADNGYRDGLQHFWSTFDGEEMATAQVLQFRDRRGALRFHAFYSRELCSRSITTGPGPVPGSVHLLWDEGDGWSNEVTFVRGPYFLLTGVYTDYQPSFADERVPAMVSDVFEATKRS